MPKTTMTLLSILLGAVLLGIVALGALITASQTRRILPGQVNTVEKPDPSLNPQYLSIPTPDGNTLHGILYLPPSGKPDSLLLAFPGNTHNPIGFATFLKTKTFPNANIAIAAFSYRGYPNGITPPSTGTPSQAAMYADSLTIYDTLTARLQTPRVKLVGYSIGTAVAAHLATQRPTEKLALIAPFASMRRLAAERYPWLPVRLLLRHPFPTEDLFANLTQPTTIIYSPTDGLIPTRHVTEVLHSLSPTVPLIPVDNTTHTTLALAPELPDLLRNALKP